MGALRRCAGFWLLAMQLWACGNDLPVITEIQDTRVIGAQSRVVGAPERATPRPGEEAEFSFAVVSPEGVTAPEDLRSMFLDCTFPAQFTGIPLCQEFIDLAAAAAAAPPMEMANAADAAAFEPVRCAGTESVTLQGVQGSCVNGAPVVTLRIPEDYAGGKRLVRGIICDRGTPFADVRLPELFGCDLREGGKAMLVHGAVPVAMAPAEDNDNPRLEDVRLSLNGRPWDAVDEEALPAEDACRDAVDPRGLLAIDAYEHTLGIELDAGARQVRDGVVEDLEVQLYVSAGEAGRRFAVFDGADPGEDGVLSAELPWTAPAVDTLPEAGQLVRLYLVAFDRRGGFDFAVRHACVFAEDAI